MKYTRHSTLEELEQMQEVLETGILLGTRNDGFHTICLYEVGGGYAEATTHAHFNVLLDISYFTDPNRLDPYLGNINLDSLLAES